MADINKKEELEGLINKYRTILNDDICDDYLEKIAHLKTSVVKYRSDEQLANLLIELDMYKRIAIYNISNRAMRIIGKNCKDVTFINRSAENGFNAHTIIDGEVVELFDFEPTDGDRIGNIRLYRVEENKEYRRLRCKRIRQELNELYELRNNYNSISGYYGPVAAYWSYCQDIKIGKFEDDLHYYETKTELTDAEKRQIELTDKLHRAFYREYGLIENSFDIVETGNVFSNFSEDDTSVKLEFIKEKSKTLIKTTIKYI